MIAIVTSSVRERTLLTALCDQREWPAHPCATVDEFSKLVERTSPLAILTRHRLEDGYSDDVLAMRRGREGKVGTIVLAPADYPARLEARQVDLGADCILRDPVRIEVLLAFLRKFFESAPALPATPMKPTYQFAGAEVCPTERRLTRAGRSIQITPQEIALVRLLRHSARKVVTYTSIYDELFSRRFEGDTANARVLFGRTAASFAKIGVTLREHVEVIPKSGYLYRGRTRKTRGSKKARGRR